MKRCCDNCAYLIKTAQGFFCSDKKRKCKTLYTYNNCQRFKGADKYERD